MFTFNNLSVAVFGHTLWGAYPVCARYLQVDIGLGPLSLLLSASFTAAVLTLLLDIRPVVLKKMSETHESAWASFRSEIYLSRKVYIYFFMIISRSITHIFSAGLTSAVFVQLIALCTPFVVALLNRLFFREPLPPYTITAALVSAFGSFFVLFGDAIVDGRDVFSQITPRDVAGMALQVVSTFFLAGYMLLLRDLKSKLSQQVSQLYQMGSVCLGTLPLSFIDDWSPWANLGVTGWIVWCIFSTAIFYGANVFQISTIRELGALFNGTLHGWRLVIAIILSVVVLDTRMTWLQILGALVVIAAIAAYVGSQYMRQRKQTTNANDGSAASTNPPVLASAQTASDAFTEQDLEEPQQELEEPQPQQIEEHSKSPSEQEFREH